MHPEIDNPEYTTDSEIYKYSSTGVLGLDLWQVVTLLFNTLSDGLRSNGPIIFLLLLYMTYNFFCMRKSPYTFINLLRYTALIIQVKSGTIFDNFLITNDPKLAEEVGNETWGATKVNSYSGLLVWAYI